MEAKHQILIVGGGNAGISVAAKLLKKDRKLDIAIIEPSEKHYYQPAWTLVGGGVFDIKNTIRSEAKLIPNGAKWIKDAVSELLPSENKLTTKNGDAYEYDYLILAPGIQINWNGIEGLEENVGKNKVCSVYGFDKAPYTWEVVRNFEGGRALFTSAATPVKCGGAPQKIMYLASDYFRRQGLLGNTEVHFMNAGKVLFGIEKYRKSLQKVCDRYGVKQHHRHNLIKIDGQNRTATFRVTDGDGNTSEINETYDMLHVTPPQSAPDFVQSSGMTDAHGWIDVDQYSLQQVKFKNVFALGDATNTKNAKTGAAIRKQAPVLVENLLALMSQDEIQGAYSGYGSCPLVTARGKVILAEFDYSGKPTETFPFNQAKERRSMYFLKKKVLPWMYWNKILKGTA